MQFVALFSLVLASVSASAVLRRDGETKNCPLFNSIIPDKATCGNDTFCPGGCISTVVSENCKQMRTWELVPGKVSCDGALEKADGDGYSCEGGKIGSVVCFPPFTGSAVCSGCRPMTAKDRKSLGEWESADGTMPPGYSEPQPPSDKPDDKPAPKTDGKPDDKPAPKSGDKPDKSGDKPDDKSGDKPDDKNTGMPADHAAGQDVPSTSSMPNATEHANQTATPTGAVTTGSATPSPTPDSPSGAEALLASGPVAPAIVALLTAGFSALL